MASVREIAEHVNVSPATVSRVLNSRPGIGDATRKRVLEAATQMGMSRHVGLRTTRYIGFVHPLGHFVGDMGDYHSALVGGIAAALADRQYDLALIDPFRDKRSDETFTQFFLRKDLRGVLLQVGLDQLGIAEDVAEEGFPTVAVAARSEHPDLNWVATDSGQGFERAVEYLHRLGHRRIAIATPARVVFDHQARLEGYRAAHRRLDLPLDPALEFRTTDHHRAGGTVVREMLSLTDRPTAVMFTSPAAAAWAVRACDDLGLSVPADLSIVGMDDSRRRFETRPVLTAVVQDAQRLGREAAACLTQLLDGPTEQRVRIDLPTVFEVNETTGPAPG